MKYFIAPRSGEKSYKNFQSTIKHGVPYENIEPYLTDEGKSLLLSEDVIYSWGNRAGTKSHWESMQYGDLVIFYAKGELIMAGEVYYKQRSPQLALAMWPPDENGNPWEYTFFLRNIRYFKMPMRAFNWVADYKSNFIIQGFMELKPERINKISHQYGSVEEMLNIFATDSSMEIPTSNEKIYVNVPHEIKPEIRSENHLTPKLVKMAKPVTGRAAKKLDYIAINKANSVTGSKGEALVMKQEKARLIQCGRTDLAEQVKRISMEDDTVGYDVSSFEEDGTPRYIEVKTSSSTSADVRFYMSANEMTKSSSLDNYYIYYVDAINTDTPRIIPIKYPFAEKLAISTDTYLLEGEMI